MIHVRLSALRNSASSAHVHLCYIFSRYELFNLLTCVPEKDPMAFFSTQSIVRQSGREFIIQTKPRFANQDTIQDDTE